MNVIFVCVCSLINKTKSNLESFLIRFHEYLIGMIADLKSIIPFVSRNTW